MSVQSERRLKALLLIALCVIAVLGYRLWDVQTGAVPATPNAPTTEQKAALAPLPVMRLALVGSQGRQWTGEWLGLAVDDGSRLALREIYRIPNEDPITKRRIDYFGAAAEEAGRFWMVGRDTATNLPVLGTLSRAGDGTNHRMVDLVAGEVGSVCALGDGQRLAIAMRKDGVWQLNVAAAGRSETERFIFASPGKELPSDTPILPILSARTPGTEQEHVLIIAQDPPSANVVTFENGALGAHTRIPLPFRPEAMAAYEADPLTAAAGPQLNPAQPQRMSRFLLVGRRGGELVLMEFELRAQGIEVTDRKVAMMRQPIPEPITSLQPLVRGSRLAAVALAYQGRPLLHVRRLDNGEDTFHNVFPHLSGEQAVTVHEGMALQDQRYWAAIPFSCRRPDGGAETALMAVDRDGMTLAINKQGVTSAAAHRDGIMLLVVRDARPGRPSSVIPIRAAGLQEGEPFLLSNPPAADTVRDMLAIGGHLGRTYK